MPSDESSYGICSFTLIPVRGTPADKAELTTQLLFGEGYEVKETSEDGKWLKIAGFYDGYEGWIDLKQHCPFEKYSNNAETPLVSSDLAWLEGTHYTIRVLSGSFLPGLDGDNGLWLNGCYYTYRGEWEYPETGTSSVRNRFQVIEKAKQFLYAPYLWGGKSLMGLDCSAFVQLVYRFVGIYLQRDAFQQIEEGKQVGHIEEAGTGDIAFFCNEDGKIVHVGIVMEYGKIIHASGFVRIDRLDAHGIYNESNGIYTHRLAQLRRYFNG